MLNILGRTADIRRLGVLRLACGAVVPALTWWHSEGTAHQASPVTLIASL